MRCADYSEHRIFSWLWICIVYLKIFELKITVHYAKKLRKIAIANTPTITVFDKLFVTIATIKHGKNATTFSQSNETYFPSASSNDSKTRALKMQTGINLSHRKTTSGNFKLRTKINGITRGSHVTSAHPRINNTIESDVVIFLSSLQSLLQLMLLLAPLNVLGRSKKEYT